MPYFKRTGGTHRRRENGQMVVYGPGEVLWAEEWELQGFRNVFEPVTLEAGRKAMIARGLDPAEVEGRVSTWPPPEPEVEEEEVITAEETVVEEEAVEPPPQVGLELKSKGGGWWDVINMATGQPINDRSLRKADAEHLMARRKVLDHGEEEAEAEAAA